MVYRYEEKKKSQIVCGQDIPDVFRQNPLFTFWKKAIYFNNSTT